MNRQASVIDKSIQDQVSTIIPNIVGDFIDIINDSSKPIGTVATTTGLRSTIVWNGTEWVSTRTGVPVADVTYTWLTLPDNQLQAQYHYWYCFRADDFTANPNIGTSGTFARVSDLERNYRKPQTVPGTPFTQFFNAPSSATWSSGGNNSSIGVGTGGKQYLQVPATGMEFDLGVGFEIGEGKMIMEYGTGPTSQRYTGFTVYAIVKDVVPAGSFGRILSLDTQGKAGYVGADFTNNDAIITDFAGSTTDTVLVQRGTSIKCGSLGPTNLCVIAMSYHSDSKTIKTYMCTYDPTTQIPITKFTGCSFADTSGVSPDTLRFVKFGSFDGVQGSSTMKVYEFVVTAFYDETPDRMMTGLYEHYKSEA